MRIRRAGVFHLVCALSLLCAAAVAFLWIKTFDERWRLFGFVRDEEKYSLVSEAGQLVVVGPPREEVIDPLGRELIWKMSNADFEWSEIGSDYVGGEPRPDTPSWQVCRRFFARESRGLGLEPAMRVWIAQARNDPARFVPAHLLLMFAAQTKRSRPLVSRQKWAEVAFRFDADGARIPEVQMRAEPGTKRPDFERRWDLQQEWSDVMETPRAAVFHGWLWLGAMVLPLAWVARPRWRKTTWGHWVTNWVALTSVLVLVAAVPFWVRSWVVDEQFIFARRAGPKVPGSFTAIDSIRSIGSSKGKLNFLETDTFHRQFAYGDLWGYQQKTSTWPAKVQGVVLSGEKSLKLPGMEIYRLPSQMMNLPPASTKPVMLQALVGGRVRMVVAPQPGPQLTFGVRALAIYWWLIVLVTAIAPAWWGWRAHVWRRRIRKEDRQNARRCLACGYDMRATPEKCPECGEVAKEPVGEAPMPR